MGCHTWAYAHLPEKAKEWNHEYAKSLVEEVNEMIEYLENIDIAILEQYAKEENEHNEDWLQRCNEAESKSEEEFNKFISEYFDGSLEKYKETVDSMKIKMTAESIRERQIKYNQATLDEFHKYGEERVIDFINANLDNCSINTRPADFGLFLVKDGKIYRETMHDNEDYQVFEKQFHDMFRIHDYDAKPCYSLEETIERCKQYGIECTIETYKFWETYPDGIIEFK